MSTRFEPIGSEARWRVVYALLQPLKADEVLSYEVMAEALDLHAKRDRHAVQMAMRRAARQLETEDKRAVESVRGVGYRVVRTEEHLRLARGQQTKAGKSLARGQSKVENVDLKGVDPQVRRAFDVMATAFSMQTDMINRLSGNQRDLERALASVSERAVETDRRAARSEGEIADILARLEKGGL